MPRTYGHDLIDGRRVPPLVVTEDGELPHHQGTIHVEGATVILAGVHQGTLVIHDGSDLTIEGTLEGTAHIDSGCRARVDGVLAGTVNVSPGAELVIAPSGSHRGTVHNDGTYVLEGERGGELTGRGTYLERPGSVVKQPVSRGGITYYVW